MNANHSACAIGAFIAITALIVVTPACTTQTGDTEPESSTSDDLTMSQRTPRYAQIRDLAASQGLANAYLLAGIAMDETNLSQCWSEAQWACAGPNSPDCGGGPVIAGSGDGACPNRAGGLGLFQFDAGNYDDTLRTYGNDVLTIPGQVRLAVAFVINMVKISDYTTDAETDDKARAWINRFDPNNNTLREQWIHSVVRYYNGCNECDVWSARNQTYGDALSQVLAETGTPFWNIGTTCPGGNGMTVGAIDEKYRAFGGCGSVLGAPITNELPTPDTFGRYSVFEHGSIYWTSTLGAHVVLGRIRDAWKAAGWEAGALGYPISDELTIPGGKRSDFEHGSITWMSATDSTTVTML